MNSEDMTIVSEEFHELSVDKNVLSETGIEYINSIDNVEGHFYRKRYLLNSYADAISFLAKKEDSLIYMRQHKMIRLTNRSNLIWNY